MPLDVLFLLSVISLDILLHGQTQCSCSYEALIIVSMLTAGNPWVSISSNGRVKRELLETSMRSIGVAEGDLVTLYNVYKQAEFYRDEDPDWVHRYAHF